MLRRKPTAITITAEDLIAFEEERIQKLEALENNNNNNNNNNNKKKAGFGEDSRLSSSASESTFTPTGKKYDPNDELKPLPGDKARIVRSRDERIGIGRRTWLDLRTNAVRPSGL